MISVVTLLCVSRVAGAEPIPFDPSNKSGSYVAGPAGDVFNLTGPVIDIHQNAGFITVKDFAVTCSPCTPQLSARPLAPLFDLRQ